MATKTIEFLLAGRRLRLTGAHETYLDWMAGDHTANPLAGLVNALPPNAVCLDIGANIGVTALIMASRGGADRVFAFEPVPSNAAFLRHNLKDNGIKTCTVVEQAIGDQAGTVTISDDGPWSLVGGTRDRPASASVKIGTLDQWYADNLAGTRIDLIKIDVEGYEPNVLAGAARVIGRWRPVIYMEFNSLALLLQGANPLAFAAALWRAFEVTGKDASTWPSPEQFIRDNIVRHQAIDDLVLRPIAGAEIAPARAARFGIADAELAAVHASTSWRLTAPLRAVRTMAGRYWGRCHDMHD